MKPSADVVLYVQAYNAATYKISAPPFKPITRRRGSFHSNSTPANQPENHPISNGSMVTRLAINEI